MIDNSINTELFECEVCGFEAHSDIELMEHFEQKANDEDHLEANMNPKRREVLSEDSVGAPVGTPGHPGIDEGTD